MSALAREDEYDDDSDPGGTALTNVRSTVTVVIPALNEARNLPAVAARMPDCVDEIVFVDGHSADDSIDVARTLWPTAKIVMQTRRGKGNALVCGFEAATSDIVVMIDADGSTDPMEITLFVDALIAGADVVKGSRFAAGGGSTDITISRRMGNRALNAMVNRKFGATFTDLCYGYMAFWRCHLPTLTLPGVDLDEPQWGDGFEIETLINVRVHALGLTLVEVPSFESDRIHGESHLNAVSDGLRVLRTIFKERPPSRRTMRINAAKTAAATAAVTGSPA
ncbi:glycosyltransferase family 2 protein [Mycobacterium yunnanensis]|uniref:Glycosyltransferase family 2 protein n=1 Tax=Mycobacterium yunnanensis TaxID=368477 RepID=A0A9X3BVY0_9MYCO|nr:glycosyltransferase family 2 protein [Mycobacterium yunnanensis]MCV7423755.1 glycosyltransferase family 2 protein [Mycobacterium yunnanensis]